MKYGNVLVIGNSGVGKSTLIKAVLGENAKSKPIVRKGLGGATSQIELFKSDDVPFRMIDTVGFEPSFFQRQHAINDVKKWSKNAAKESNEDSSINVIWFCVDGTAGRLFPETIDALSRATKMWESVPVIVVITKSYSKPEREDNKQMVYNAFAKQKRHSKNLKGVIPVVADTFRLTEEAFAAPEGISELINLTNECMPEGIKAATNVISAFQLKRKRVFAQSVVAASTVAGATVGALPLPIPDAGFLTAIEVTEINTLAHVFNVDQNHDTLHFRDEVVAAGTVGLAAKQVIQVLKAIPGINIGAAALNAIVAGCIVAGIGEGTSYAFEKVYLGEKSLADAEWVHQIIDSLFSTEFLKKAQKVIEEISKSGAGAISAKMISEAISNNYKTFGTDK